MVAMLPPMETSALAGMLSLQHRRKPARMTLSGHGIGITWIIRALHTSIERVIPEEYDLPGITPYIHSDASKAAPSFSIST